MSHLVIRTCLMLATASAAMAASAQMASGTDKPMMADKMSAADMRHIKQCKAMPHDAMMKSAMCQKMMKLHPSSFEPADNSH